MQQILWGAPTLPVSVFGPNPQMTQGCMNELISFT